MIENNQNDEQPKNNMDGMSLGINLMVSILLGGAIGYGIDQWLNTLPAFMILMFFMGFAAGIYQIWKKINQK